VGSEGGIVNGHGGDGMIVVAVVIMVKSKSGILMRVWCRMLATIDFRSKCIGGRWYGSKGSSWQFMVGHVVVSVSSS